MTSFRSSIGALAIWAVATAAAYAVGFRMVVPWHYWQLLDETVLLPHPVASLCLLHSQPPVLNALAAALLMVADASAVSVDAVITVVFALIGALGAVVTWRLVREITGSWQLAAVGVALVVADPAYHTFANLFFYEFILHLLLLVLATTAISWVDRGEERMLFALTAVLAAISLTRTLFHPAWAVAFWLLVVWLRGRVAPTWQPRFAAVLALLVAALLAWPAKNALVYGQFLYSSMTGYSLAYGVTGCTFGADLAPYSPAEMAALTPAVVTRATSVCGDLGVEALTAGAERNGTPNWNAVSHLLLAPARVRCAVAWIAHHPAEWLQRAAGQYAMWMQPAFVDSHLGRLVGPASAPYIRYVDLWRNGLFMDLRPLAERAWPSSFLHEAAVVRSTRRPVPYTLYGFVLFLALVAALAARGNRAKRRNDAAIAWILLALILCPMVAACLTDGTEGNRMRFATTPLVVAAFLFVVHPRPAGGAGRAATSTPAFEATTPVRTFATRDELGVAPDSCTSSTRRARSPEPSSRASS
jgi:hypothetical protein